ncbi:MAG: O-antigen/teichoic acid export membrane protein [Akkermansiaceae bacterium]
MLRQAIQHVLFDVGAKSQTPNFSTFTLEGAMKAQSSAGKESSIYLGSKLLTKSLSFGLIPVWTFVFSPNQYGVIGNLMAWAGFLSPLIMIGLPSATIRLKSDCSDEEQWYRFVGSIALTLLATSGIFLIASWLIGPFAWNWLTSGDIPYWPLVPITLVAVSLGALARLALVVHQAEQQPGKVMAYEQALSTGVIVCALVGVFLFHGGVTGYMFGGLVGAASVSLFFAATLWKRRSGFYFEGALVSDAVRYGLPLIPQALAAWTLNLSDRVMLERFSGLSEAGLYNLAANFGIVISMVAISINQALLPRYLQRAKESFESREARGAALREVVIRGFIVLLGIFIMAATAGPMVLGWMVNERYLEALPLLVPILGGCFFFGMGQFLILPLLYEKKTKFVAAIAVIGAVVNVALNLYFIPKHGAIAAAYTTLVSYAFTCLLAYSFARRADWFGMGARELVAICGGASLSLVLCLHFEGPGVADLLWRFTLNGMLLAAFAWWLWKLTGTHETSS